ncbi:MAG: methyltransferase domain-containing protein [Chloroflexi bacterium]|nr:methyltransferase domain-containing protein [Chloroflexota bacterium]
MTREVLAVSSNVNDFHEIRATIRQKYVEVSRSTEGQFRYLTGKAGAKELGYAPAAIRDAPSELFEFFCGVGNPFSLGDIYPGEMVLDVGCGAGFDAFTASRLVGAAGRVYGIDLSLDMVGCAKNVLTRSNIEVQVASSESIPFCDDAFDLVISNGVLNLSPWKEESLREIYRVLKPSGRFQFADIVLKTDLPQEMAGNVVAWSQ